MDFPPNKLKTGSGEYCLLVLDKLSDAALQNAKFTWQKLVTITDDKIVINAINLDQLL